MTEAEAFALLKIDDPEAAEGALEQQLFEVKQFFLSKPLLWKTAQPKIKQLNSLEEVASILEIRGEGSNALPEIPRFSQTLSLLDNWKIYTVAKNTWKVQVLNSEHPGAVLQLVQKGFDLENAFVKLFSPWNWIDEVPVFGVEPDPMVLQKELSLAYEKGWKSAVELYDHKNHCSKELLLALKRLSLLSKYLNE